MNCQVCDEPISAERYRWFPRAVTCCALCSAEHRREGCRISALRAKARKRERRKEERGNE